MASASGKGTSKGRTGAKNGAAKSSGRKTSSSGNGAKASSPARNTSSARPNQRKTVGSAVKNEAVLIMIFALAIFAFLCVVGIVRGTAAGAVQNAMFGIFGLLAYAIPIIVFLGFAFGISNRGSAVAAVKLVSGVALVFVIGILSYMLAGQNDLIGAHAVKDLYMTSANKHNGGGVVFGLAAYGLYKIIGFVGTLFLIIVLAIIAIVFITEKSFISGVKRSGAYIVETAREDAARRRARRKSLREAYDDDIEEWDEYDDAPRRADKRTRGVVSSAAVNLKESKTPDSVNAKNANAKNANVNPIKRDIHEITILDDGNYRDILEQDISAKPLGAANWRERFFADSVLPKEAASELAIETVSDDSVYEDEASDGLYQADEAYGESSFADDDFVEINDNMQIYDNAQMYDNMQIDDNAQINDNMQMYDNAQMDGYMQMDSNAHINDGALESMPEPVTEHTHIAQEKKEREAFKAAEPVKAQGANLLKDKEMQPERKYVFPPIDLLKKGEGKKGDSSNQLKETALRLQQTLQTFGVKVTITDISQGPSVTRYEMQPEQGVKVSRIVGLADDIKLNLAATDIRIEAPIPGKAAVGIEVPNKENSAVAFRDLIENDAFKNFSSNLAFAVGKDIGGQTVVTDIAKMPHALIAGATGSGKSVCINTIIMSILYKADPADVKLIMIDPKVVELSVYNGIPHLMIPVVTDPKKASAALNWGVTEMDDRYRKFAELGVRDLKGYNQAADAGQVFPDGQPVARLPQILIIVDELADLMMVASGEVEASICRLAQLARACGIHLVIATQRPSVDVITGLIKANMPSRIAFSVSSSVDSRTILDMNGAEKLLGKGDMLFYPQGYTKPARVQGAFVSDSEVTSVVDFLKNQMIGNAYSSDIEDKIKTMQGGSASGTQGGAGNDIDAYFAEAGRFVIEKDKASIGMLQRVFKIGFNRAARIVDQLEAAGVVGAEEGTKPRTILMSMEQFENYIMGNDKG